MLRIFVRVHGCTIFAYVWCSWYPSLPCSRPFPILPFPCLTSPLQIQDKFQLDMSDEEAGEALQKLMQESVTALFPRLSEKIHKWKQYWDNR